MSYILKLLGLVSQASMTDRVDELVGEYEQARNKVRKETFDEMDKLNPTKEGEKIQQLMLRMNRDITLYYEKETAIREFIAKLR